MRPKGSDINIFARLVGPKMANILHIHSRNAGSISPIQKTNHTGHASSWACPSYTLVNWALDQNHFEN